MTRRFSLVSTLLALGGLFIFTIGFAQAGGPSHLSGSYKVVHKTDVGLQTRVRLQLQLANSGQHDLLVQRLTLVRSLHPDKVAHQTCSLTVHPGSSLSTTQEFTMLRSEYSQWSREKRITVLAAVEGPGGHRAVEVMRLDQISGGKAD
ncbi:MAG: hypothetical protein WCF48_09980 [Terriglobales bacterium]